MAKLSKYNATISERLNADDLAEPLTIEITGDTEHGGKDFPISYHYVNEGNKPFQPCKTMRRLISEIWGDETSEHVGRKLTVYNDKSVMFKGKKVGGVRISAMSHIGSSPLQVTIKHGQTVKDYTIQPLKPHHNTPASAAKPEPTPEQKQAAATKAADRIIAELQATDDTGAVLVKHDAVLNKLKAVYPALYDKVQAVITPVTPETPESPDSAPDEEIAFI